MFKIKFTIQILVTLFFILLLPSILNASKIGVSTTGIPSTGLNSGLVGWWTFDGKDIVNGVIKDVSGNGNNGNPFGIASSTFYTSGKIGQAGNFDGVNDKVNLPSIDLGTSFTYSSWVLRSKKGTVSATQWLPIFNNGQLYIRTRPASEDYRETFETFVTLNDATNEPRAQSSVESTLNQWFNVVVTWNGTLLKIYVNGEYKGQSTRSGTLTPTIVNPPQVGAGSFANANIFFWPGKIDDVRIYNRALSASEIKQLYLQGGDKIAKSTTGIPSEGLNSGLVGRWTFDGKDIVNGVIKDVSGNGNNGNPSGIASSTFYTSGKIGQAGNFDGVDDYVKVSDSASVRGLSKVSISSWIKPSQIPAANQSIYDETQTVSIGTRIGMRSSGSGKIDCRARAPDNQSIQLVISSQRVFSVGVLVHAVCTYDLTTDTIKLYVNGEQVSTTGAISFGQTTFEDTAPKSILIGSNLTTFGFFPGVIDDVRIYNRSLSASEIKQLYLQGGDKIAKSTTGLPSTGLNAGLVGWWTFDGKDIVNGVIKDVSGNGNNGNPSGIASSTFYSIGKMGQAVNFDGSGNYVSFGDPGNIQFDVTTPFSVAFWTKLAPNSSSSYGLVTKTNQIHGLGWYVWSWFSTGQLYFTLSTSTDGTQLATISSTDVIRDNIWHHIVATYSGNSNQNGMKLYIDGVLNKTGTSKVISGTFANSNSLTMGNVISTSNRTKGKIDDVRIYNRALSSSEILQLYKQNR